LTAKSRGVWARADRHPSDPGTGMVGPRSAKSVPRVILEGMFHLIWAAVTLPFRILAWVVEILGRLVGLVLGFSLMVLGVALGAGSLFIFGIPLFLIGLLLTLRSLG
jgi:hypothetical protein